VGASVLVDQKFVGIVPWTDTVVAGPHEVKVQLTSIAECPSAVKTEYSTVSRGKSRTVSLNPEPCGYLGLNVTPEGARFTVSTLSGDRVTEGLVPLQRPLVLPEGRYLLMVTKPACQQYGDTVRVESGVTHTEPIKLFC
jgi:hypothetical protein